MRRIPYGVTLSMHGSKPQPVEPGASDLRPPDLEVLKAGSTLVPLDLPVAPYVPGQGVRPDEDLFTALKRGIGTDCSADDLAQSPAFLSGLDLLTRGYFWEAHELFEAVWLVLPPASAERSLLQGLIQLANAALKVRMGRKNAAVRIVALAETALREAFLHGQAELMGVPRTDVDRLRDWVSRIMTHDFIAK
jgi:hypothetical protein